MKLEKLIIRSDTYVLEYQVHFERVHCSLVLFSLVDFLYLTQNRIGHSCLYFISYFLLAMGVFQVLTRLLILVDFLDRLVI